VTVHSLGHDGEVTGKVSDTTEVLQRDIRQVTGEVTANVVHVLERLGLNVAVTPEFGQGQWGRGRGCP